jgi:nucleotide-binding universal stress UspA family protein
MKDTSKRILVAASLTRGRDAAFGRGLAVARAAGAELYLLHAVPADRSFSTGAADRLQRRLELQSLARQAGVAVKAVEQHGDPAEIIELHAATKGVDLIVMGADHPYGSRWLRASSVAERVLRRTTVPTLVVTSDDVAESVFGKVLVAVDLSPDSSALVDYAARVAGGDSPRLTVLHAISSIESAAAVHTYARWMVPEYRTHLLHDARRELETLVSGVPREIETRAQTTTGPAAKAIGDEADAMDADLVVVGRSGRFRPLGSTALRVLRSRQRALLVIPVTDALRTSVAREWPRLAA